MGREAARRALGERPFDVQLLGTLALLSGQVAEMATGEGKTLSGALAAAGYVRRGHRVHVMSVNDYLARRDAEWMGPVYDLLGVTVGWVTQASTPSERRGRPTPRTSPTRRSARSASTCSATGWPPTSADLVTPDPDVALIDEADSVLVDEALVPLVLAGSAERRDAGREMAEIVRRACYRGCTTKSTTSGRNVHLTDAGAPQRRSRPWAGSTCTPSEHLGHAHPAQRRPARPRAAQRDVDYIVRDGRIQLINASRGRVARRQRWPDGLHAAVEAKEGCAATESGEILDSITIQALVRRYPQACGMTGTAVAVGEQLREFYGLEIAVIPPNLPCVREDEPDRLYRTAADKEDAVVREVADTHATGRPVLIGTLDVAESERLAEQLSRAGLSCVVLNAKNDAQEAAIVAEAGALGAITVSTQMAGRGTDIRLGGTPGDHDEVAGLGGLLVIGIGRHASSRLDDQLRGRAGRQGDPGGSVFFLSMEDELITTYVPDAPPRGRRTGRPGHRPAGALDGRPRPAGGRGRPPADPPEHLAVQHAHRGAAAHRAGAPRRAAAHRRRAEHAAQSFPERAAELRERVSGGGARRGGAADQPRPPRPGLGGVPGPPGRPAGRHPPAGARARARPFGGPQPGRSTTAR